MTETLHRKPPARPRAAVIAFLCVYAAAMFVLFAPRDTIQAIPAALVQPLN